MKYKMSFESRLWFLVWILCLLCGSISVAIKFESVEKKIDKIEQQLFIDYEDNNIENYG